MTLQIISPEGTLSKSEARSVVLPGGAGSFEVLRGHAPLVSTLLPGAIVRDGREVMRIAAGIVEVNNDVVTIYI